MHVSNMLIKYSHYILQSFTLHVFFIEVAEYSVACDAYMVHIYIYTHIYN